MAQLSRLKKMLISIGIIIVSFGIVLFGTFFAIEVLSGKTYTYERIKECMCFSAIEACDPALVIVSHERGRSFFYPPGKREESPEIRKQIDECLLKVKNSFEYKTCEKLEDKCFYNAAKETERYLNYKKTYGAGFFVGVALIIGGLLLFTSRRYIKIGFIIGGILAVLYSLVSIFLAPLIIAGSEDWSYLSRVSLIEAFSWFFSK
jgi:hypothetical protein